MTSADNLRNTIINQLLAINNKDYLLAIYKLLITSPVDTKKVKLSDEQILMLQLSDKDIKKGKLISHKQLDKDDMKWLKEL
jgi:hypothetical protein